MIDEDDDFYEEDTDVMQTAEAQEELWANGDDMEQKASGEGITVQIRADAMERIEIAAMAGMRQHIASKIDGMIKEEIASVIEEKLAEVVGKLAEDAILSYLTKPRPRTNQYGETVSGSAITISDQIPDKVASWMAEKVNPRDGSRADNYGRDGVSRLEYLVSKQVRDELDVATKAAAASVTEQAKKVVAAHVGRFVAEQMVPQIEVGRPK